MLPVNKGSPNRGANLRVRVRCPRLSDFGLGFGEVRGSGGSAYDGVCVEPAPSRHPFSFHSETGVMDRKRKPEGEASTEEVDLKV